MATLTIRNLPDGVRDRLRRRAAAHGHSMEAEVRALIEAGVSAPGEGVREMPGEFYGAADEDPMSWMGSLKGQVTIIGDWAESDKDVEKLFLGEEDEE